jgi:Neuraminidase (sialidase)
VTNDGAGTWVAVWQSDQDYNRPATPGPADADYDILVARSTDAGVTWSAQVALNSSADIDGGIPPPPPPSTDKGIPAKDDLHPQVTTDGAGTWVAVWQSEEGYNRPLDPPRPDYDILVARSTDGGVTWSAQVALNTTADSDDFNEHDVLPQLTTDGQGTWIATWRSTHSLGDTIGADADILFARSTDGGISWTAPAPLNTNAASDSVDDTSPQLTTDEQTDEQGSWVAVWQSMESL